MHSCIRGFLRAPHVYIPIHRVLLLGACKCALHPGELGERVSYTAPRCIWPIVIQSARRVCKCWLTYTHSASTSLAKAAAFGSPSVTCRRDLCASFTFLRPLSVCIRYIIVSPCEIWSRCFHCEQKGVFGRGSFSHKSLVVAELRDESKYGESFFKFYFSRCYVLLRARDVKYTKI